MHVAPDGEPCGYGGLVTRLFYLPKRRLVGASREYETHLIIDRPVHAIA
jgi:hypothetical protein